MNNAADEKEFLGTEPIGRILLKLALPTVTAQVINMLYNIVDRIYIGHIPGSGALALTGMGVCLPIIMIVTSFATFAGAGGAPRASIALGRKDKEGAERILGNSFSLLLIFAALLTAILLIWGRSFLLAFGASENTIEYASSYLGIYAIGTVFVLITIGLNAFITAQGFAKVGMLSVLIGAVSNIILDPVFIFVLGMGVRGAALATVISQGLSCIWVLSFLFGRKTVIRLRRDNMKLRKDVIGPVMLLGLATFIMQSSESVISICFNSSLLKYGGDIAVGAMTILTSVMQFAMLPLQGLGQGAQPIISYNYGANSKERVKKAYFYLLAVDAAFALALWAFVQLCPSVFASLFTSDQELIAFASKALRVYAAVVFLFGIQMSCQTTFTSIGCAFSSISVAVMRKFVLLIPLIFILPSVFTEDKVMAVYLAEPVADSLAVTFTAILFFFQFRKVLRNMDHSDPSSR